MSEVPAQNGATQAASAGEAAAAVTAAAGAAAAAPAANGAAPAAVAPAAAAPQAGPIAHPVHVAVAVPAAVAAAQAAPVPAKDEADCKPKKVAKKDGKALDEDEDQNLSQPADGCVLPVDGAAAAPAPVADPAPVMVDDGSGGGISSGLLIGAGVLAAIGVGVLALAGDDEDENRPPVANADTATATEGATTAVTGSVATNDSDPDGDPLTYTLTGTAPAGLTLSANGSFTFDPANPAYNSLAAGATQAVVANYSVTDGKGGTATSTLTITVTGTNDNPVLTAVTGPAATEGGAAVTATVAATDPDTGAVLTYSLVNPVAGVTINATTGVVTLNPADPAYNGLAAGQTQAVAVSVRATDAQGGTATSTVTFNVTGTNDAPVAVARTAAGNEDTQITGNLAATDPDANAVLTYSVVGTAPAGFTLNPTTGAFTLDTTNAAYQPLAAGQTQNVVVNYQVSDGTLTSSSTLTITVTGTADGPVATSLDRDDDSNTTSRFLITPAASTGAFAFTDDIAIANTVRVDAFGADDTLTFNTAQANVSFASGDFDNDGSPDDLRITVNNGGTVSDIVFSNSVSPDAVVIDYASAEAAVGPNATNFLFDGTAAPPPPAPPAGTSVVNIDTDTDANLNTYRVFDAAGDGFLFTDTATVANSVEIVNFGNTDRLVLDEGNLYSFSNVARDSDGLANDLRITLNVGGTVSDIFIKDVVNPDGFIENEAGANLALNQLFGTSGVDFFQFA